MTTRIVLRRSPVSPAPDGSQSIGPRHPEDHELAPGDIADLADLRHALDSAGLAGRPFDIVGRGNASPAWEEDKDVDLDGLAQASMTWWPESLIHFDPLELSMAVVDAGPASGCAA
ncbi:hypothetical protein [Actinophytocola sp.]|uniref:hypothetical protein n=1 Tax=Actinophytocola sp. TaxID=1872138 RepID=UPI00389A365F